MATNVYLKLEDESGTWLKGNSTADTLAGWIEVMSWSHGFSQPTSAVTKSSDQGATSRVNHCELSFTKFLDAASAPILKANWSGQQLKTATFSMFRASGSANVGSGANEYLQIVIENAIISSYSISGGGDELPMENITLNYAKVKYVFKSVDPDTGKAGSAVPIQHDLTTNKIS